MAKEAHASHILLKSKGEAKQLAANLSNLKAFQRAARKKSMCPSARRGGDLGWFESGRMVPAFEDAVWEQPLKGVGEPVKTEMGYHLIWVHERRE